MNDVISNGWGIDLKDPISGRSNKPRKMGLTMVLDKGLGVESLRDLITIGGNYIDLLKFSFGTSLLYPQQILSKKIELAVKNKIDVYPGGTLLEIAASQDKVSDYLYRAKELNYTAVEISNGTLDITPQLRRKFIIKAKSLGFKVLSEVGKKDRNSPMSLSEMQEQIKKDLADGVNIIIIEGRESGKGVSIYNDDGSIDMGMFEGILATVQGQEEVLLWEAPLKKQQVVFIRELGPNVNMGNISVDEVVALESLRRGLRGDTFAFALEKSQSLNFLNY